MIAYSLLLVPFIEPKSSGDRQSIFSLSLPTDHWWEGFFPEGSWQTKNPKIINSKRGILLANTWERIDEKTWKLEPLTMIMPQSKAGREAMELRQMRNVSREDMWIISAEQGATIHFDEEPQLQSGNVPSIARGELKGVIEVSRQIASEKGKQPWRLQTYDLTINRTQVSTRREVLIEWNNSVVRGHDLLIRLRSDLLGKEGSPSPSWGPLDELELYHVDEVSVELPDGGLWADLDPKHLSDTAASKLPVSFPLETLPAKLTASCAGRFNFDFRSSTATLQKQVYIRHQVGELEPDEFSCERITVLLEPPPPKNLRPVEGASRSDMPSLGGIQIKRFDAIGADSLAEFVGEKWVELRVPTLDVQSQSKTLSVDLQKRRIEFGGKLNQPGAAQSTVLLKYQGKEFQSKKRVVYQAAPDSPAGTVGAEKPKHLGWLIAEGPGEVRSSGGNSFSAGGQADPAFNVRWQKGLKMAPAPENDGSHWIEVLGDTFIESEEHGFLTSDRIEIWLAEVLDPENRSTKLQPVRVFSNSNTILSSPSLSAKVSQLDLQLKEQTPPLAVQVEDSVEESASLELSDSEGNPMYQWVSPPAEPMAQSQQPTKEVPSQPIAVTGNNLQATLVREGKESWIEQLQIDGPVELKGSSKQDKFDDKPPIDWNVQGNLLLLATNRNGEADLQIDGAPAKIKVGDGLLEGETIRFNQTHNLVVMDHPGEFTIPKSLLASATQTHAGEESTSIEWFDPPHCRWQGRMIFDGKTIRVEDRVEYKAGFSSNGNGATPGKKEYWRTAGVADALEIHLLKPMKFQSDLGLGDAERTGTNRAEFDRISLLGNVNILAWQLDHLGEKKSGNEILVPSLTFRMKENQIVGDGPGWLQSRFLSGSGLGRLANSGEAERRRELRGAYLKFRDSMVGSLKTQELTFDGNIELLSGPISSWEESVSPNEAQELTQDQILLNSDQLRIYDTKQLKNANNGFRVGSSIQANGTWEFKAMGNVAFNGLSESGEYNGNGHQLSYSRSKNMLVLRGDGRKSGYLRLLPSESDKGVLEGHVDSIAINPETLEMKDLKVGRGGIGHSFNQAPSNSVAPGRSFNGFQAVPNGSSTNPSERLEILNGQDLKPPDPRGFLFKR